MKVIDLTHVIHEDMQVFPGTEPPRLTVGNTLEKDGFRETALFLYSHTGTHMDTPAHMLEGAAELDKLPVSTFCGKAAVIPCLGGKITMEEVNACREMADRAEFIIFHTGWDKNWGKEEYFGIILGNDGMAEISERTPRLTLNLFSSGHKAASGGDGKD